MLWACSIFKTPCHYYLIQKHSVLHFPICDAYGRILKAYLLTESTDPNTNCAVLSTSLLNTTHIPCYISPTCDACILFGRFLKADVTICKLLTTDPNRNCTDEQVRADWTQYLLSWDNNNLHLLFFSSHPSKGTCQYLLTEATDPNRNCADMWGTANPIDVGWDAAPKSSENIASSISLI